MKKNCLLKTDEKQKKTEMKKNEKKRKKTACSKMKILNGKYHYRRSTFNHKKTTFSSAPDLELKFACPFYNRAMFLTPLFPGVATTYNRHKGKANGVGTYCRSYT